MGQKKRSDRLKILVVIPSLVMGGAERLTVYILQRLSRYKFDLALCLFENKGSLLNELPHNIKIYNLEKRNRWSFFRLIFALNKVIKNYNPGIMIFKPPLFSPDAFRAPHYRAFALLL